MISNLANGWWEAVLFGIVHAVVKQLHYKRANSGQRIAFIMKSCQTNVLGFITLVVMHQHKTTQQALLQTAIWHFFLDIVKLLRQIKGIDIIIRPPHLKFNE